MADQRMIHRSVICSDEFTELSFEAQALYMHLTLEADNFGFVAGVKKILRSIGAKSEALEELIDAHFVIRFDAGVYVLRHWMLANGNFKNDRNYSTNYPRELAMLCLLEDLSYGFQMDSNMIPDGFQEDSPYHIHSISSSKHGNLMQYINRALQEKGINRELLPSTSVQNTHAREVTGDTEVTDGNAIVYTSKRTGKKMTLQEYLTLMKWATGSTWEMIQQYRGDMDDSLIRFAIDQTECAIHVKQKQHYLKAILDNYKESGFKTWSALPPASPLFR